MRPFVVAAGIVAAQVVSSAGQPALTRVEVSLGDVSINKVPQLVAADQGLYAKYHLDVHQTISAGAARAAAASGVVVPDAYVNRAAGSAPIEIGGGSPMIYSALTRGTEPRVIVLTQEPRAMDHVIARSGIDRVEDLKGKRLGFSGTGAVTHFSALMLAHQFGWTPDRDITLVGGAASLDALQQNKVDAILGSAMVISLASRAGFKDIGDLTPYNIPVAGSGIMVEKDYLAAHRDVVLRFIQADIEATRLMQEDEGVFKAALAKWFNITDGATQAGMFALVHKFEKKPYPSVDGIKQALTAYAGSGTRRYTADAFYDSTLIADLDKQGFLENPK